MQFSAAALFIENKLGDPNQIVRWFNGFKCFYIIYGAGRPWLKNGRYEFVELSEIFLAAMLLNSNVRTEEIGVAEFYTRYAELIKPSPYYLSFVSYILGSHAEA